MINAVGRQIPEVIEGYRKPKPFEGAFKNLDATKKINKKIHSFVPGKDKLLNSIDEAIEKIGIKDGMTLSFHHHFRNGDKVVNMVMERIKAHGIKDIHVAATGLFACHEPLVALMEDETITQISVSTFSSGPVPKAICAGKLKKPCIMMSHGGRPRAIESGDLHIDVAFIGAPTCDKMGNMNGTDGKNPCGYLSYVYADAEYADYVVAITDNLVDYPAEKIEISQEKVDYVIKVDSIGDSSGIESGTTKITEDPVRLKIASDAANLIECSGYLKQGISFQTGASSTSVAVASELRKKMIDKKIVGSFGLGGITTYIASMLDEGLFKVLFDVQCFDVGAIDSARNNPKHIGISGSQYANPHNSGSIVNNLDVVILGATEIDTDFNVNVTTGSNGIIMGASGGHSDCAAGAKLTIVVANLTRKTFCVVRDKVTTVTTPGESIDALVTDYGIAINPNRLDLIEKAKAAGLKTIDIKELKRIGEEIVGPQEYLNLDSRIVGIVEYRDGTVIDVVRQV